MEPEEDDMIVVIIKDDDEEESSSSVPIPASISIKEEVVDETENATLVEELLETAAKHGTHMDIAKLNFEMKEEPCDYEYLEEDEELTAPTTCDSDEEFVPDAAESDLDEKYNDNDFMDSKHKNSVRKGRNGRFKMLSPSRQVSFVQKLRDEHPEYEFQDNLLVEHIAKIMKETKPLPPPPDFYRVHDLMFECTECCAVSANIPAVERHYQEKHGPRYLICLACGVDFRSKTNLYKHEKRCNAADARCVLRARALAVGRKGRHRPFLPKYPKKQDGYKIQPMRSFGCGQCAAVFRTKSGLAGHLHLHRGERPHACDQHAASTSDMGQLRHLQPVRSFGCGQCAAVFRTKSGLAGHLHLHRGERPHACDQCGTKLPALRQPVRSFGCGQCAAVFRTKSGLAGHLHLHRGERPHACDQCGAAYTTRSALYRHYHSHTDARFICDICDRQFRAKTALVYHMDTHLPQRKFACTYEGCTRRFAQKYALTIHMQRVHENLPPPCACQICPRRFTRMSILKVHMKKEHGMILMTRNMFFKKLPKMSATQVQQAKIIFNNGSTEPLLQTKKEAELIETEESIDNTENFLYQEEDAEPENEATNDENIMEFVKNFVIKQEVEDDDTQEGSIMVIENGQVEFIDKKNVRRKEYEQLIANFNSVVQNETPSSTSMPIL
ncbi:zinc finger protein 585A [Plutella xylostella]|uniref:zinc finger protein 585A n=1 Tax=Plutella xylostella TaxID=51655 RepID=UPI0020327B9D|nr:zinc finger protein 585A [Plutella xylostella]